MGVHAGGQRIAVPFGAGPDGIGRLKDLRPHLALTQSVGGAGEVPEELHVRQKADEGLVGPGQLAEGEKVAVDGRTVQKKDGGQRGVGEDGFGCLKERIDVSVGTWVDGQSG